MRISQTTGYALDLLATLADATRIVRLPLLAGAAGVPLPKARRIMVKLTAAGLARGQRGRTGGFALGRPLEQINLSDVIDAMCEPPAVVPAEPSDLVKSAAEFLERETSTALASPISRFVPAEMAG